MAAALSELEARLDEVYAAAHFMDRAYRLKPRVGHVVRWDGPTREVDLVRAFIVDDTSREEEILSALVIRAVAALERFVRQACSEVVEIRARSATTAGKLPVELHQRNLVLSAKLLGTLDSPKDHISFNPKAIVSNLATCDLNGVSFELNTVAFTAFLESPTVKSVEKSFSNTGLTTVFEDLGRFAPMQQFLNTQGTTETRKRTVDTLTDVIRWRNNLAHAGDDERTININELDRIIEFFRIMGRGIDAIIVNEQTAGTI
jgi:hypothetical protein